VKAPIQFGKYYLLDRVAVGGMAEVFRSKTFGLEGSERIVALKRMLPMVSADKELVSMFIDEAKLAIQLNHPNICQVFDWGKVDDSYYLAMEYVSGCDLRAVFQRCKQQVIDGSTTMPTAQACLVVMKLCEGLDYAHNKKDSVGHDLELVHRDVSPPNIMLSYEGEVKLIDFGIAKVQAKRHTQTEAGVLKGKFAYMSPEQVKGEKLDRRSDIFSVGIVLYELLTGERLFPVDNELSSLEKIRNVEVLPPSTYNRRIPEELERIVLKALSRDPNERYQTAQDLHGELQQFMYTTGEFYSRKEFAAWMKRVFKAELEAEQAQLEAAREFRPATMPTQAASEPLARARATMSMAALRVPGEATGALRVPKEQTGAFRVPKEQTGAMRVPKDEGGSNAWTGGSGRPKRPGSTPPPPPRQAVQSIAEAASSMAAEQGRGPVKPVPVRPAGVHKAIEAKPLVHQSEEDTAVDGPSGRGKVSDPRFNDDSLSTRPFEPQDQAILEAAARQGQKNRGTDLDEGPTRAFMPASAEEVSEESSDEREDPGDVDTHLFAPGSEALSQLAAAAVPNKAPSGVVRALERPPVVPLPLPPPISVAPPPPLERPPLVTPPPMQQVSGAPTPSTNTPPPPQPAAEPAPPPPAILPPLGEVRPQSARVEVLPPPALNLPPNLESPPGPQPGQSSSGRAGMMLVIFALLVIVLGGGAYWLFGRSGELIVVSDPGRELIVSVDSRPVAVTDSPVRLRLQPGQHTVSVQRNGHTPWNDSVLVPAGETVVRNIHLEPIVHKTGGFTLLSEPPGAMVTLDGNSLNQVTPLRVQSLLAGAHSIDLRLGNRVWHREITVEAEKTIEVKAILPEGDMPTVTPDKPTVTPLDTVQQPGKPATAPEKPAAAPEKPVPPEKPVAEKPPVPGKPEKAAAPGSRPGAPVKGPRPVRGKRRGPQGSDTPVAPSATGNSGYLRINSRPWSKIIVDGIDTGLNTPQTSYRVTAGSHQITLFNPQFNIKETIKVTVAPGEIQTITKIFQQQ